MKKLLDPVPVPFGAHCARTLPIEERRWAVKVFPKGEPERFVAAIRLPLPKLPMRGWAEPSTRCIDELPRYFQFTEKIDAALLFSEPNGALQEAFKIEEFGVEADIFEVDPDPFSEATELVTGTDT